MPFGFESLDDSDLPEGLMPAYQEMLETEVGLCLTGAEVTVFLNYLVRDMKNPLYSPEVSADLQELYYQIKQQIQPQFEHIEGVEELRQEAINARLQLKDEDLRKLLEEETDGSGG